MRFISTMVFTTMCVATLLWSSCASEQAKTNTSDDQADSTAVKQGDHQAKNILRKSKKSKARAIAREVHVDGARNIKDAVSRYEKLVERVGQDTSREALVCLNEQLRGLGYRYLSYDYQFSENREYVEDSVKNKDVLDEYHYQRGLFEARHGNAEEAVQALEFVRSPYFTNAHQHVQVRNDSVLSILQRVKSIKSSGEVDGAKLWNQSKEYMRLLPLIGLEGEGGTMNMPYAMNMLDSVIKTYPETKYAGYAAYYQVSHNIRCQGGCGPRGYSRSEVNYLRDVIQKYPASDSVPAAYHYMARLCGERYDFHEDDRSLLIKQAIGMLDTILIHHPEYVHIPKVLSLKQRFEKDLKYFDWKLEMSIDSLVCAANDPAWVTFKLTNTGEKRVIKLPYDSSQLYFKMRITELRENGWRKAVQVDLSAAEDRLTRKLELGPGESFTQTFDITQPVVPSYGGASQLDFKDHATYEIIGLATPSYYHGDFIFGDTLIVTVKR